MTNIYRSEATITARQQDKVEGGSALAAPRGVAGIAGELVGLGGGGDVGRIETLLKSRELVRRLVEKNSLLPRLFEDDWDSKKNRSGKRTPPGGQVCVHLCPIPQLRSTLARSVNNPLPRVDCPMLYASARVYGIRRRS
jgi:hypothetical protein